jgi:hypothetical protein
MKKLLLFFLLLSTIPSFGQWYWNVDFDSSWNLNKVYRDTISNPNCKWQIGQPSKTVFTSARSVPNAIVTDLSHPVPANDTSTFFLIHHRDTTALFHEAFTLDFMYQMDGDSTDYGIIEVSPDEGKTWVNMLTQDSIYQLDWNNSSKPTLKGSTNGWKSFHVNMWKWASSWGTYLAAMTADTILFKFTYITDNNATPRDGWMIDDILVEDMWEGISEIQKDDLISIYPNPTSDNLQIQRTNDSNKQSIQILNNEGKVVYDNPNFTGTSVDTKQLANGIYFLKYSDKDNFSVKKFVVQH